MGKKAKWREEKSGKGGKIKWRKGREGRKWMEGKVSGAEVGNREWRKWRKRRDNEGREGEVEGEGMERKVCKGWA